MQVPPIRVYGGEVSENEEKPGVELTQMPDADYTLCGSLCTVKQIYASDEYPATDV